MILVWFGWHMIWTVLGLSITFFGPGGHVSGPEYGRKTIVCSIKLTTELRVNAKYTVPAGEKNS